MPTRRELNLGEKAIAHGLAIASGVKASKDLGNMPPNIANPAYLASQARRLADDYDTVTTKIIGEQEMEKLGMTSYLAVGRGSKNESMMSIMEYKGNPDAEAKPIVLIGKGLTFDSGGISLKPGEGMDEMKYDMCGAASVFGAMKALAKLNLPINVIGVLAGCENMPGSNAYRPGDILTTMSGQTVEVLNTDAEGRLVLCDALTYSERFEPDCVVDVATLTGACVIALGHHISGVISNHNPLAHELVNASEQASDRAWRLPMADEYHEQLRSHLLICKTLAAVLRAQSRQAASYRSSRRSTIGHTLILQVRLGSLAQQKVQPVVQSLCLSNSCLTAVAKRQKSKILIIERAARPFFRFGERASNAKCHLLPCSGEQPAIDYRGADFIYGFSRSAFC
ncbi:cytosol aminopeptidase PepA [Vibrio astriarenae]|nr:cytosol aminopeptidase PepA [Vibrio sp. C7]